jgi:hypothetical protein
MRLEEFVRRNLTALVISLSVCAALASPLRLAVQGDQERKPKHHHYKLIDVGTLGGPGSSLRDTTNFTAVM